MHRDNLTSRADGSVNLFVDAGSMVAMMESTFQCQCTLGCQHSISLFLICSRLAVFPETHYLKRLTFTATEKRGTAGNWWKAGSTKFQFFRH